jgi:hypothetical protein
MDLVQTINCQYKIVIQSKKNKGSYLTFREGVKVIINNEKYFCILENDSIPTINYFYFIRNALTEYEDREDIILVSGCSYFKNQEEKNFYFMSGFPYPMVAPAFWSSKIKNIVFNDRDYIENIRNKLNTFDDFLADRANYLVKNFNNNEYDNVDYDTLVLMISLLENKKAIYPFHNLVENVGFDKFARNINFNRALNSENLNFKSKDILPTNFNIINFDLKQRKVLESYISFARK